MLTLHKLDCDILVAGGVRADEKCSWRTGCFARSSDLGTTPLDVDARRSAGMHRQLTLSHHDGYTSRMKRGGELEPETVCDYALQIAIKEEWSTVCEVADNYQRLRRHVLPESTFAESLRILVSRSNGIDHARIMEVRIQ